MAVSFWEMMSRLADAGSDRERSRVLAEYSPALDEFVRGFLARTRSQPTSEDVEAALDHVKERLVDPRLRIRGKHAEASARSWLKMVARNRVIDLQRSRQRHQKTSLEQAEKLRRDQERQDFEDAAVESCRKVVPLIFRRVHETLPPEDATKWDLYMRLGFEVVANCTTTAQQIERYGYLEAGATFQSARTLVYQHRRRGRVKASEILAALVAEGVVHSLDAERVARYCKLPWPPDDPPGEGEP
jgi:DNA-directed RNA polymerase specialized sigma24 family protein